MTIELSSASVRPAGQRGVAARTAAGFVVLTSSDGGHLLQVIDAHQASPAMVERLSDAVVQAAPASFSMLFTAGGDPYLLAWGDAKAQVESATARFSISPMTGQLLVHPLALGAAATISLSNGTVPDDGVSPVELSDGSIPADSVRITIGAKIAAPSPEPSRPDAAPVAPVAPVAAQAAQPAAQEVVFADDLDSVDSATPQLDRLTPTDRSPAVSPAAPAAPAPAVSAAAPAAPAAAMPEVPPQFKPEPEAAPAAATTTPPSPSATAGPVMVLGVVCAEGHHNHPDARYCSVCGTKMGVHLTTALVAGPRPPLGVLVVDDGSTYSIERDLVVGRDPSMHADVRAGVAIGMPLSDDTFSLSRQHARIVLDDWTVIATDLGSSNGTWLNRGPNPQAWTQIGQGQRVELEPGDRLRMGGRVVQVELHHVR